MVTRLAHRYAQGVHSACAHTYAQTKDGDDLVQDKALSPGTRLTSWDVARKAGVSQSLVSRAFSGNGRVAAETREHILKVAADLGWQPNALARSMVSGDTPLVAIVTSRLGYAWRAQVMSRLLEALDRLALRPLVFHARKDAGTDELLAEALSWQTKGVIVSVGSVTPEFAEALHKQGRFLVTLNRGADHEGAFSIATDNHRAGMHAATALTEDGARRPIMIAGPDDAWASRMRAAGYTDAMRQHGKRAVVWHYPDLSREYGKTAGARFLALPRLRRPDAVFAANDALALGFMDHLREFGVRVPDDVALIGFDDLPEASYTPYRLTTFRQPLEVMTDRIVDFVAERVAGRTPPTSADITYVPATFVPRATLRGDQ